MFGRSGEIYSSRAVYTVGVSKHLVDLDDDALAQARAELGTATIKDTVNQALRQVVGDRAARVAEALDTLAAADLEDRDRAWR